MLVENESEEYSLEKSIQANNSYREAEKKADEAGEIHDNNLSGLGNPMETKYSADHLTQKVEDLDRARKNLDQIVDKGHEQAHLEDYNRLKTEFMTLKDRLNDLAEDSAQEGMSNKTYAVPSDNLDKINTLFEKVDELKGKLARKRQELEKLGIEVK